MQSNQITKMEKTTSSWGWGCVEDKKIQFQNQWSINKTKKKTFHLLADILKIVEKNLNGPISCSKFLKSKKKKMAKLVHFKLQPM